MGLAPALWRVGGSAGIVWTRRRIAKAGAGRKLHAMQFSMEEQKGEGVVFISILNFDAPPPVLLDQWRMNETEQVTK